MLSFGQHHILLLPKSIGKWISKRIGGAIAIGLYMAYGIGMAGFCLFAFAAKDLPDPDTLRARSRPVSVKILDRYGREIMTRGATVERDVNLEDLPFHIPMTILAAEDKRFYNHIGIDPIGILRAALANMKTGHYAEGGSTITQQLSRNVFLSTDKTLKRKAQEVILSIWLERDYTKTELLELYLSRIYFGQGAWGFEAASQRYFNKSAKDLSLAEAAVMAGLLKGPSAYNPVSNLDKARARMGVILDVMESQNLLGPDVKAMALAETLTIYKPKIDHSAQYFIDWIWPVISDYIGTPDEDIIIKTTLDLKAQAYAQNALTAQLAPERGAAQGALISLDGTGGVIAMIGGADYQNSQFNRAAQAQRQPGSAFKPFVYLAALRAGLSPWSQRNNNPITLGNWSPENFNGKYGGQMTLHQAFARSTNMVAIALSEEIGLEAVIKTAEQFGIHKLKPFPSLSLGAQPMTPLALTESYLPFANWGKKEKAYGILSITTPNGRPLYHHNAPLGEQILSHKELSDMNFMMRETVKNGTARRAAITGHDIGGKTGTTNDFRDAWFIGYRPDIVTGIWVGADDNSAMTKVTGGTIPAMIFRDYMTKQLKDYPKTPLPVSRAPQWVTQNDSLTSLLDQIQRQLP